MQLGKLIRFQETFKEVSINELRSFMAQYPWCQTIHMLLLKKMHSKKVSTFRVQLAFSAIFISDRNVLYHLINNDRFNSTAINKLDEGERLKQPASTSTTVVSKAQKEEKDITRKPKEDKSDEPLNIQKTITESSSDIEPAKVGKEKAIKNDTAISDEITETTTKGKGLSTKEKGDENNDIIEQFIKDEPRIVPREDDFSHAEGFAESSNEVGFEDLVTETLANIYLDQGNKKRAITILEKLSLTIPEKSSYFASRIKEIKLLHKK